MHVLAALKMCFVSVSMILRSLWKNEELEETRISNFWKLHCTLHCIGVLSIPR